MSAGQHPAKWWHWCMSEDKKETEQLLIDEKQYKVG